jgi:hypothetical protein
MSQEQSVTATCCVAAPPGEPLGLIHAVRSISPQSIQAVRLLGQGRAAQARLVTVTLADGTRHDCVEKVFRPALLTRIIYRVAFQAPFAYQACQHAILASFYRRRVASAVVRAMNAGARVAEPYYVRWDAESQAFVLASEFIRGHGIVPAATDSHSVRRRVASWWGRSNRFPPPPAEEVHELLDKMTTLESLLRHCGLEGSGWQVCKRAMVSTSNLLRTPEGYVVIDLESGIPAVLVPSYIFGGLRLGALPPFDDVDGPRLRNWLATEAQTLTQQLGVRGHEELIEDAERLLEHTAKWKQGELALARNRWRVWGRACRQQFKDRCLDIWRRREIIDDATYSAIAPGRRIFTRLTFLLGLVPGKAGRFLQRISGNRSYRVRVSQFFSDRAFRREAIENLVLRCRERWRRAGRLAHDDPMKRFGFRFLVNAVLASVTPRGLHRWISDPWQRRNVLIRMWLICVSGRFQSEYGRYLIRSWIRQWEDAGRLTLREAMQLRRQLGASDMDEYVRCFGMHMGLKLLLPLLTPLKYGGGAVSLLSGNLWFLFFLMLMPVCRSIITVWRMIAGRRPPTDYVDALIVGALPVIGSLAYPVQMYSRYRELSAFLLRDSAARLGRWIPIYGGKDSRVEIAAIRSVNVVAECLEIGLASTAPIRRRLAQDEGEGEQAAPTIEFSAGRWHRLANEQLRLIAESEAAARAADELEPFDAIEPRDTRAA